jgi:hypothetical protein
MGQDMSCDALSTSSSAHPTPQASVEPAPPPPHVLSKANDIALSLVKPTSTHAEAAQTLYWLCVTFGQRTRIVACNPISTSL